MGQDVAQPRVFAPTREQKGARPALESAFHRNGSSGVTFERVGSPGGLIGRASQDVLVKTMGDLGLSVGPNGLSVFLPARGGAAELTNPYRENWVVFSCCQAWANAVGSVPAKVFVSDDPKAAELGPDHPVSRLFASPCPWATGMQQRMASVINRKLTGEDLWFLCDAQGNPIGGDSRLAPIELPKSIISTSGFRASDTRDETGLITHWHYGSSKGESPQFPASSVLHFADYNPEDPQRGLGAAQVAMRQLGVIFQAERQQESVYRAGGPGYWLINKQLVDPEIAKREQTELEDRLQASNTSLPRLLRGDWTVTAIPGSPKDLGIFESMGWARDAICSIFQVPPPVIGILEDAKYANMAEAWRQFWLAVAGYLRGVEDVVNSQFFPRLKDGAARNYRLRFDLSGVDALREDKSKQQELALKVAQAGVGLSLSGGAKFVGLEYDESIEGVDTRLVASSLTPLDEETAAAILAAKPPPPAPVVPPAGAPDGKAKATILPPVLNETERRGYARNFYYRVLLVADLRVYARVHRFLSEYEKAQLAKIAKVAGEPVPDAGPPLQQLGLELDRRSTVAELESLLLLSEEKWAEEFRRILGTSIGDVYAKALADMAAELGVLQLPMTDPQVQRMLATQLTQLVEGVNSTLATRVKAALIRVLGEPSTITDLRQAVQAELPALTEELRRVFGTKSARALTIARTETGKASANARVQQAREAGIEEIEWIHAGPHDDSARPSHLALDGEHREFGKEFKHDLRWPHDERAPAGEVINCNCLFRPIIKV